MAKTTPTLKVIGNQSVPNGYPFVIHTAGTADYEALRLGSDVDLELLDGTKVRGTVSGTQVGALIDLLVSTNGQALATFGRASSPRELVQTLTEASGSDVLDVTKLYTAVTITVSHSAP